MSICASPCSIFLSRAFNETPPQSDVNRVFYYDFSANTITPIQTANFTGFFDCGDIANTSNRLWLNNNTTNKIWEYSLQLCPLSTSFIRQINIPSNNFGGLGKGLTAVNNNNLITAGKAPNPKLPIYLTNIIGSTAVNTLLFYLPNGRYICEDILYVASPSTGAKIILTNYKFSTTGTTGFFLTQYDVNSSLLEMDKFIPSSLISEPRGLFTRGNKIFITDASNGNVWSVGLSTPYPLTLVQQIPDQTIYYTNGTGASTSPECNKTFFKPQPLVSSFPGIVAINQDLSCEEWSNPNLAKQIYVSPVGPIVAGETKFYLNESKTDSVEKGLWVSDGTLTYLMGDDGVVEESYECDYKFDNVISFDPVGGIDSTVRLYSDNSALGSQSTVSGGISNTASGDGSTVSGGLSNTASNYYSVVSGGALNVSSAEYSFIGSGRRNTTTNSFSVIAGGEYNYVGCECSIVGGGQYNTVTYEYSSVLGGCNNQTDASFSSVLGGFLNRVEGSCSVVLGGDNNVAFSDSSIVGGGSYNENYSTYGTIGGGFQNKVYLDGATVGGGQSNTAIQFNSTVAGGYGNTVNGENSFGVGFCNNLVGNSSFILSNFGGLNANCSVILGGTFITGDTDNTVYVPNLNIGILPTGTSVNNLGIDSNGFVIVGTDMTGATPSLSDVIAVDPNTGGDIVMTNGSSIFSENSEGFIQVNDFGLGSSINFESSQSGSSIFTVYNQQGASINVLVYDGSDPQSTLQMSTNEIKLTTADTVLGSTGSTDNGVVINGYKYNTSTITTTDATPTEIIKIENSTGELVGGVTNVKVWCNAFDSTLVSSGLSQEFTSAYLVDGSSILSQLSLTPTTNLNYSTFDPSVTANLTYTTFPARIILQVTGLPSQDVFWKCRIRWSQ